jgi:hypothetical protein
MCNATIPFPILLQMQYTYFINVLSMIMIYVLMINYFMNGRC